MNPTLLRILSPLLLIAAGAPAQDVIPLYPGTPPGSAGETYPEKAYFSKTWNTDAVTNATSPSLTLYKPAPGAANGSAIVICPGRRIHGSLHQQ